MPITDPRPSGPKGLHSTAGVVADAGGDPTRPQAKPQPRVRQKLTKPEGPLKRQARRKDPEAAALQAEAVAEGGASASQLRRAAQRQALEAGILAAARALFDERGADALTLREVGAAVGYSHATLYSFFADKNALLARLAQDSLERLLARLEGARDGAGSSSSGAAVARAFVSWGLQHPHDYRLLMLDTPAGFAPRLVAGLDGLLPEVPAARAAALWAGLHGLVLLEQGGLEGLGAGASRAQRLGALLEGLGVTSP